MANADRPCGLEPFERVLRARDYKADGTIFPGDAVKLKDDGEVERAAASNALLGVALSYATAGQKVLVADHPDQIFKVQSDSADVDAQTDINLNYNIVATAGDTTYRVSRMELDGDSGADTATLPLKLLKIDERVDNALGAAVDCIVVINNHQLKGGTGTAGV